MLRERKRLGELLISPSFTKGGKRRLFTEDVTSRSVPLWPSVLGQLKTPNKNQIDASSVKGIAFYFVGLLRSTSDSKTIPVSSNGEKKVILFLFSFNFPRIVDKAKMRSRMTGFKLVFSFLSFSLPVPHAMKIDKKSDTRDYIRITEEEEEVNHRDAKPKPVGGGNKDGQRNNRGNTPDVMKPAIRRTHTPNRSTGHCSTCS